MQHMIVFMPHLADEALIYDRERSNRHIQEAKERAAYHGIRFFHPPLFDLEQTGETPSSCRARAAGADGWKDLDHRR